ncbi:MAG: ferrous iron transport protein A [Eudoraea sp.]|nr:ferrous iron transport protein A [Eudoraea sp.]NNJ37828.1 ferrous iron transport protein A [Flavobacteriaceae bacterium]MBT8205393.1 ferrous iron transport protein A [Eudoraea sp.]MBT8209802.1 ferrous iron transport protein A [Eudoraea sp.]MBT8311427.1 ferrous iron transport protein A [Eudoraea sp.]
MLITVADLKNGQRGVIREFQNNLLPIKLLELGCLPGNEIELVQVAPLSDPLYINVNGSHIAIRREMARYIEIDLIEAPSSHD